MNKILVTGGTGYIGSHATVELQKAGFKVVIVDNLSNSKIEVLDRITQITGVRPEFSEFDLRDQERLKFFFNRHRDIVAAVHFAAVKAVGESAENPLKYYDNNVSSSICLLKQLREAGVHNLVFSSTAAVYGQANRLPVTETSPIQTPSSPYGNTKKIIEEIISDVARADEKFKSIILRYFNVVGAHESVLIGELPLGEPANLVPYITQTAIGLRPELKIFGCDYNTRDGFGVRDYIHVVDLARAHVLAVKRLLDKKSESNREIFNLGTGRGYSVKEVVDTFEKVNGVKINYRIIDRRPGDISEIYTLPDLAKRVLGWRAEYGLEEMLVSAWEWEKALNAG